MISRSNYIDTGTIKTIKFYVYRWFKQQQNKRYLAQT